MDVSKSSKPTRAAVAAILAVYVGNFHFIYGIDQGQPLRKVSKVSWSLSETVINLDEIKATPALALRLRYPLFTERLAQGLE